MAGLMGLSPEQFWGRPDDIYTGMTLREFDLYGQGYRERVEQQVDLAKNMLAWHAANVMNCLVKRRVTADQLLGKGDQLTPSQLKAQLDRQAAKKVGSRDEAMERMLEGAAADVAYEFDEAVDGMERWLDGLTRKASDADDGGGTLTGDG